MPRRFINTQNKRGWIFTFFVIYSSCIQKVENAANGDCNFNKYMDGNVCRECSVGYFGPNCLHKCSPPYYGYLCSQECETGCEPCHYMFGCIHTTETTETMSSTIKHFKSGSSVSHAVNRTSKQKIFVLSSVKPFTPKNKQEADLTALPDMTSFVSLSSVKSFKLKNKRETDFTALRNVTSYVCK
ncbi:uncharacterized protein [Magallana gigas]|uniref:uncharacterized protein n=1 Tax=Magallana gigas TaxID=29159 RepID=UPI0033406A4A